MKKINKSNAHARSLISKADLLRATLVSMAEESASDTSSNDKERAADIALFQRYIKSVDKMIGWWTKDIERNEFMAKAKATVPATTK
jgi:hypothetical protein